MVFLRLLSLVTLATAVYGQGPIVCPGVTLVRVGCFKSANPKVSAPNLLFTEKVNYRQWDSHLKSVVCKCVAKRGKYNIVGIRNIGECRTGNLYAKEGSSALNQCNTWGAKPCVAGKDCVGNTNTMFVYRVQKKTATTKPTTKPTTKKPTTPKGGTTAPTKSKSKFANLTCYSYSIKIKMAKPPPAQQASPAFSQMRCSICKTIRSIYSCYPCYQSVHFINVTTAKSITTAHMILKFHCKAAHLKPLIAKLQNDAIVDAKCHDGVCPQIPMLAQGVPGCTMLTACPAIPACSVPACGAPVHLLQLPPPPPPAPVVYTSCPAACSTTCAPTCAPVCCQPKPAAAAAKKKPAAAAKSKKPAPKAKKPLVLHDGTPLYDYSLVD